jgi:hypothetical protein
LRRHPEWFDLFPASKYRGTFPDAGTVIAGSAGSWTRMDAWT